MIRELRDSKTREILDILPYELEIMTPSREAMREVADFARKTGDFASLSATDLRLIALSLMIEKELNGESFIKKEPNVSLFFVLDSYFYLLQIELLKTIKEC